MRLQAPSTARRKSKVKSQKSKVKRIVFQALALFEMVCLFTPRCTRFIRGDILSSGSSNGIVIKMRSSRRVQLFLKPNPQPQRYKGWGARIKASQKWGRGMEGGF